MEWDHGRHEKHGAVVITDGLTAQQSDANIKRAHEAAYPLDLIELGIKFMCINGTASVEKDRLRILAAIGSASAALDEVVHGVLACAALRRALEKGGERRARFLEAVRRGRVRKMQLALVGSAADTPKTWREVVGALDATTITELSMQTKLKKFPVESLGRLTTLVSIDMSSCTGLRSLPQCLFGGLIALKEINMSGKPHAPMGLTSLPEGLFGGLTALTSIDMSLCSFTSLPEGLFGGLTALTSIDMSL